MSKVSDLSIILKEKIKSYDKKFQSYEVGRVLSFHDGIVLVSGLTNVRNGEIVQISNSVIGSVISLEENFVGVIIFETAAKIFEGDEVKRLNKILEVPAGDDLLGRIISPLGEAIDGLKTPISFKETREIESDPFSIMARKSVDVPLKTGILLIDSMIPIGRGQRELLIGDRKTGKTAIAIDTIINQKNKKVRCIYVSIGQKNSSLSLLVQKLKNFGALDYTTIVVANSSDSESLQYISPYSGIAIAEKWMLKGYDVLIVFDDLSKHAVAYRTLSLLLRRPPGREAYPGDIFYLHSRLLERAGRLKEDMGGGSVTALPIVETQAGDISAYIPTNVISITDGQIFLVSEMFNSGQRPAVDVGLSVSRVGGNAQTKIMKSLSAKMKLVLANYGELKSFSEFTSDVDPETKKIILRGKKIYHMLNQKQYSPYSDIDEIVLLFLIKHDLLEKIALSKIEKFRMFILKQINKNITLKELMKKIEKNGVMSSNEEAEILSNLNLIISKVVKENNE